MSCHGSCECFREYAHRWTSAKDAEPFPLIQTATWSHDLSGPIAWGCAALCMLVPRPLHACASAPLPIMAHKLP